MYVKLSEPWVHKEDAKSSSGTKKRGLYFEFFLIKNCKTCFKMVELLTALQYHEVQTQKS